MKSSSPSPRRTSGSRYQAKRMWHISASIDDSRCFYAFSAESAKFLVKLLNTSPDRGRRKAKR